MTKKQNQKILVTGSAGFIGYHLVEALKTENCHIIGVDNLNDYYEVSLKIDRLKAAGIEYEKVLKKGFAQSGNYRFYKLDLKDYSALAALFAEHHFDIVINLAAQAGVRYSITNPKTYIQNNIVAFSNIIELSQQFGVQHFVYASSSSVYGLNTKVPFSTSDHTDHPVSLYAASKKSNEMIAHVYSHLFDLPTTGLRFFTVYGPWGRPDMAYYKFTRAICAGEAIKVYNHGRMQRDFTFVQDIIEGVRKVIWQYPQRNPAWDTGHPDPSTSSAPFRIFNIGRNQPVQLLDFIEQIEKALGRKAKMEMQPMQPGDVKSTHADSSPLIAEFGYTPVTGVKEGIGKFVEWFKTYYNID